MKNKELRLVTILILSIFCFGSAVAQGREDQTFVANTEGILQITGTAQEYAFVSDNVSTSLNRDESRIAFIFPLNSFAPANNDPLHLDIYNDIFASQFPLLIYLTVPIDNASLDLTDFSQPLNLVLNGVLTFEEASVQLPVEISVFSINEKAFYNMATRFTLEQIDRPYEGKYRDIITGEFALIINDALWRENLDDQP